MLKRWLSNAILRIEDPYSPDVNITFTFMHVMYLNGSLYGGLCATRSELSNVVTIRGYLKLSEDPLVSRYLKDIYHRHPPLLNNVDYGTFHFCYDNMDSNDNLQFKALVKKAVMLFIILGERRIQALFTLSIDNIVFKKIKFILFPNKTMKHARPNALLERLNYHHYTENNKLYTVNFLTSYIRMRSTLAGEDIKDFIISFGKHYKSVLQDTIFRKIKSKIADAGFEFSIL